MGDYYISNADFKIKSRLTVSPVCLTIDYNKKISGANLSSQFFVTQSESIVLAGLNPFVMESNLVFETILYKKPKWQALIDYACLGVHWKPNHTYRVVMEEDFLREKAPASEPFLTLSMSEQELTFTTNPLPVLTSTSPLDNASSVTNNTTIQFVFDRLMRPGTGNIYLYKVASPSNILLGTYNVNMDVEQTNSQYDITTFSIDTLGVIEANQSYYILTDAKVFRDFDEFYYPQITSNTTYNFTTAASTGEFPDLISFVMSSGTVNSTYIRYRDPGAMTVSADTSLVGPTVWRIRTTPSSITADVTQTSKLTYTNGGLRSQLSTAVDFYDIFVNYTANGRGNIDANFNYTSIVGLIKQYISSISSSATLTGPANWRLRRSLSNNVSSAFSETTQGDWAVLDATRAAETYTLNTTVDITNGPLVKVKSTTGNGNLTYTMTVTPDNTSAVTTLGLSSNNFVNFSSLSSNYNLDPQNYFNAIKSTINDDGSVYAVTTEPISIVNNVLYYVDMYRRNSQGSWSEEQRISLGYVSYTIGTANQVGYWADSVSISSDGLWLAIGIPRFIATTSPYTEDGQVRIYNFSGGVWNLITSITGSTNSKFGANVSLDSTGTRLLAHNDNNNGTYNLKIYSRSGTTWTLEQTISNAETTAMNADGSILATGPTGTANNYIRVYTRSGTTWTLAQTITGSDAFVIRMSPSGNYIYSSNIIYKNISGTWTQEGTTESSFYYNVPGPVDNVLYNQNYQFTKLIDDSTIMLGFQYSVEDVALVRIYKKSGTTWSTSETFGGSTSFNGYGAGAPAISGNGVVLVTRSRNNIYFNSKGNVSFNSTTKALTYSGTRADCNRLTDLIRLTPATGFTGNFNLVYTMVSRDGVTTTKTQAITRV